MKKSLEAVFWIVMGMSSVTKADTCYDLWYERTEMYSQRGVCLQTKLARDTFGTQCWNYNPYFTTGELRRLASIQSEEFSRDCHIDKEVAKYERQQN